MSTVDVRQKILNANNTYALRNGQLLKSKKLACWNMISSPGSGKTTILTHTIQHLQGNLKVGVIEGDIQTDLDAERIRATQAPAIQVNTEGACHLSAIQVNDALGKLPLDDLDVVMIENVGNLVCPGAFELGEHGKIVVLSVAEGDDKPAKYPAIFAQARVLLINKVDMLDVGVVDFDMEKAQVDARRLNHALEVFPLSAKTGAGFADWCDWLKKASVMS
ncbi:hydrogenase nickel incorporation protein HypB [Planctomycetota bacterium]